MQLIHVQKNCLKLPYVIKLDIYKSYNVSALTTFGGESTLFS